MRTSDHRSLRSPLALPLSCYARGSSCPQCGRGSPLLWRLVFERKIVLHRRPHCGQQLLPRPRRRVLRACSDDLTIKFQRPETRTGSPVPNRPPNRDSFTLAAISG